MDEILMTVPLFFALISGSTALIRFTGPQKLVSNRRLISSGSPSSTAAHAKDQTHMMFSGQLPALQDFGIGGIGHYAWKLHNLFSRPI